MESRTRRSWWWALAMGVFAAGALVLSLSDRASVVFGWSVRRGVAAASRAERLFNFNVVDRTDIPVEADVLGHFVLWGFGMLVMGFALWRIVPLVLVAAGVFAASVALELAQAPLTGSRATEFTDAVANGLGVLGGAVVVAFIGWYLDRRELAPAPP